MTTRKIAAKGLALMALGAAIASLGEFRAVGGVLGGVTAIVGTLLVLYGLYTAMPAHPYFKLAAVMEVAIVALSVVRLIFNGRILGGTLFIVSTLIALLSTVLVCGAIGALLKESAQAPDLTDQSKVTVLVFAVGALVCIACTLISWIPILNFLTDFVTGAIAGVVMLLANLWKAFFYFRASRALSK